MKRIVLLLAVVLAGCGLTSYQRLWDIRDSLHTPEMEQAIKEARPGIPRGR